MTKRRPRSQTCGRGGGVVASGSWLEKRCSKAGREARWTDYISDIATIRENGVEMKRFFPDHGFLPGLAVCRALACQVLQLTVFRLFYGLALGRGGNTKTPKISALRVVTPQSPTAC